MWTALRSLAGALLALLAINTVAVLLLNALYESTALPSRHLWRPVLYRNLIFTAPWLALLYFGSRAHRSVARDMHVRMASLFTRLYRAGLWLSLLIVSTVEAVALAENLLFHQVVTLTRTPGDTLNLLHAVLVGLVATVCLMRTSTSRRNPTSVGVELAANLRSLLWHSLKSSALFGAVFATAFMAGAFVFYKTIVEGRELPVYLPMPYLAILGAGYVLGGLLCGAFFGGVSATRARAEQIVRTSYTILEPLIQALLREAAAAMPATPTPPIQLRALTRPRGLMSRIMLSRFKRHLRGNWLLQALRDFGTRGERTTESIEALLRDRLIQLTVNDVRGRLRLLQWAVSIFAMFLWWVPALLPLILPS